ncbi:phosphoribosylanthranilate isomerase [Desulfosporosinus sp. BICA1-9]|uniref:phosphoribosylanthranilate isomerase n=1 Tax=Desulfosporosinus sp. BICA1-9 TaxID=1531958 RepID=UPI00054B8D95|nr:phosphoribosylanthranilate isomerase [Desulfosporosinus sp. BICA1-9]KJS47052.1 MAG: N-(5'-phosphoribosyl)anthranilate isomerase [Peptococcaceae bacterium BRH_c23]KJS88642.1 MAG: N-(5'-phosphoribosyl)anthranilate isomerase [Desulfosporosinus sp. BICA1-9]HBW36170.1 phosphoribosylanthranilate isomerase [Desulfosporosinus sp.]
MRKIKICGLFRECDIDYVNEALPDFIGFVFAKSRRQVSGVWAEAMRPKLKPEIIPVGVFVNESLSKVAQLLNDNIIEIAQLHGEENENYIQELKALTNKPIIKAVRVLSQQDIEGAQDTVADYLLLDNGAGGTGESFDWSLVSQEKNQNQNQNQKQKPFFLAGGLKAGNIKQAIAATSPYSVDLSSGVETAGLKDRAKILEIVRRMRNG